MSKRVSEWVSGWVRFSEDRPLTIEIWAGVANRVSAIIRQSTHSTMCTDGWGCTLLSMPAHSPQVYVVRLHFLAQINQPCRTVFSDHISVFTPRHFRCWVAGHLARKTYRVRHLYPAVSQAHSELWGHVGACVLVILDTTATSSVLYVLAELQNVSFTQPSSLYKVTKHLVCVYWTGLGQFNTCTVHYLLFVIQPTKAQLY